MKQLTQVSFVPGQIIIPEGKPIKHAYIIKKGECKMSATSIVKKIAEDEDDFNDLSDEV